MTIPGGIIGGYIFWLCLTSTDCYFLGCCIYLIVFSVCLCNLVLIDFLILHYLESFVWDGRPNNSNKYIHLKYMRAPSLDAPQKKTSPYTVVWMWDFLLLIKTGFFFIPDVSLNKARKRRSVFLIRMMAIWPQIMWVRNVTQLLQMSKDLSGRIIYLLPFGHNNVCDWFDERQLFVLCYFQRTNCCIRVCLGRIPQETFFIGKEKKQLKKEQFLGETVGYLSLEFQGKTSPAFSWLR